MQVLTETEADVVVEVRAFFRSGEARVARMNKGETQAEAARKAGVAEMTISRWERGKTQPRPRVALRVAPIYAGYAERAEAG